MVKARYTIGRRRVWQGRQREHVIRDPSAVERTVLTPAMVDWWLPWLLRFVHSQEFPARQHLNHDFPTHRLAFVQASEVSLKLSAFLPRFQTTTTTTTTTTIPVIATVTRNTFKAAKHHLVPLFPTASHTSSLIRPPLFHRPIKTQPSTPNRNHRSNSLPQKKDVARLRGTERVKKQQQPTLENERPWCSHTKRASLRPHLHLLPYHFGPTTTRDRHLLRLAHRPRTKQKRERGDFHPQTVLLPRCQPVSHLDTHPRRRSHRALPSPLFFRNFEPLPTIS
ncbi:hypothetical protein B0T20DRAFT_78065 [Sordaria brevicollis]|uniref:Uncharacterized protein n=1 Tax=Sordaria brevicollis TaxID=83679 RepID=A0AAE0P186_SORBR|nr:hypothetical protein B0T20DRAFT_78065 [Sordaria brevicollis]